MSLARVVALHLRKDMRLEWRSKDSVNSMLFFALLVVVVFAFAFDPLAEESRLIAGGIGWVALLFATIVALNQSWARELRKDRKSTRLNSSHVSISYAVFCLKKKKHITPAQSSQPGLILHDIP